MSIIRGISGIRGIVGETLTYEIVGIHSRAFSIIQKSGGILLARDSRSHGDELLKSAIKSLHKSGRKVLDCGIIPTPTAQFLVEKHQLAGGIVITASHNPSEWNGMKFIDSDGCFLDANKNTQLFQIADEDNFAEEFTSGEAIDFTSEVNEHIQHTINLSAIDSNKIRERKFKVVVDSVNGAASKVLPKLLSKLNCEVIPMHCELDGKFPRGAEPLPENLAELSNAVIQNGADVGFATDPDGDRLAVVDENGNPLGEEYTLTICADGFLAQNRIKQPLVTNLSTTMALDKIAEKYKTNVTRSAVGEINVVNLMKELNSPLGGEGNGGVILPESHYGRDSLVGCAMFLNRMAQTNETVSKIFESMPQFTMVKTRIQLDELNPEIAIKNIADEFYNVEQNTVDGLKLIWADRWVHIRKSNTEPIIRIYAEAPTKELALKLVDKIKSIIN
ncbi:MAG: phosphoglucosamine mutase [Candidatus Marinimicrobia bacterium]|nr:phosphoglucosamine mutase [Candidatus Neomarinimicrobiota bacterium]MBL7023674.1 phosphoglucosamine mutase [Candidatus Neomarinimicrobiota bacterium]MBL7109835.1 phosphoglucosamine mutase [Candidatus Neomarinimicrobiota bacterium]